VNARGNTYAEQYADVYDMWFGRLQDPGPVVSRLAGLAGSGPVLELGIGTGRVALPLQERGIEVHGIDAAEKMVDKLRAKPGGATIPVTLGDFSEVPVDGAFSLVYAAAGTFFELPSQDAQVRCFQNVAGHLRPGGRFVFDSLVPEVSRSGGSSGLRLVPSAEEYSILQARQFDLVQQRYTSHYLIVTDDGVRRMRVRFRYAWPGELDLMARLAGLRLAERTGNWAGAPFTSSSVYHVSVYEPVS
jgi:SAM-dependent methyltransferase